MTSENTGGGVVSLTSDAVEMIKSLLYDQGFDPETAGLRLSIERGGCAGLSYKFELTGAPEDDEVVYETAGVRVFVDATSQQYLDGAEFSVEETAHGTGFRIDNPNAEQECGCGLSFR